MREIAVGKAEFIVGSLEQLDFGEHRFDKIFAVRVGFFLRQPERALRMVENWLAPEGKVFIFLDRPSRGEATSFHTL